MNSCINHRREGTLKVMTREGTSVWLCPRAAAQALGGDHVTAEEQEPSSVRPRPLKKSKPKKKGARGKPQTQSVKGLIDL